jgi:hypothetical protein
MLFAAHLVLLQTHILAPHAFCDWTLLGFDGWAIPRLVKAAWKKNTHKK